MRLYLALLICITCICCQPQNQTVEPKVDEFIRLYEQRADFDAFLDLYDDDMVLEDIITGYRVQGKEQFAEFFNWPDERFQKGADKTFIIEHTIIEGNTATIKGYFTPFVWDEKNVEAMQFTTLLYYNDEGKIIKHIDWINYPNDLIDYSQRENSNDWVK
ncbi:nuclear transport factor 2 family protein [Ekhidna sp. To15]|uniref:nuclear transport factor 2 family protein n=1 Tax=Ekhidna sp. To15 TaxID=3395267 RepID=UPI003F522DE2